MFVDFIHNWNLTSVINKLQQSSISSPDVSSKFKVNPQTLVNFSIPPYSKNEKIITDQSSIHPFKIRPNNYLNMSQCNLIVKKLMLRPKFKKSKQNISFFHKKRFSHLKTKRLFQWEKPYQTKN